MQSGSGGFYNLPQTHSYNSIASTSTSTSTSSNHNLQSLLPPPPITQTTTTNRPTRIRRKRSHGNTSNTLDVISEHISEDLHERGWVNGGLQIRMERERSAGGGSSISNISNGNGGNESSNNNNNRGSFNEVDGGRRTKRVRPNLENFEPAFASLNLSSPGRSGLGGADSFFHQNNNNNNYNNRYQQPLAYAPPTIIPHSTTTTAASIPQSTSTSSLPVTPPLQQGENHTSSMSTSSSLNSLNPPPIFSPSPTTTHGSSKYSPTTPFGSPIERDDFKLESSLRLGELQWGGGAGRLKRSGTFEIGPNKVWVDSLEESEDEKDVMQEEEPEVVSFDSNSTSSNSVELPPIATAAILAASGVGTLPNLLPQSILDELTRSSSLSVPPPTELGLVLYRPLNFGILPSEASLVKGDERDEKELAFESYRRQAEREERVDDEEDEGTRLAEDEGMMEVERGELDGVNGFGYEPIMIEDDVMMEVDF